jgi:hypothetical protein
MQAAASEAAADDPAAWRCNESQTLEQSSGNASAVLYWNSLSDILYSDIL